MSPLLVVAMVAIAASAAGCKTDLDCSLNGVCAAARCVCDPPWTGPACGVLGYAITPKSGFNLYTDSDPRNTWNGAILQGTDGLYHCYKY